MEPEILAPGMMEPGGREAGSGGAGKPPIPLVFFRWWHFGLAELRSFGWTPAAVGGLVADLVHPADGGV